MAVAMLVVSATIGAMAFTTGSVSRSVSADVVTDDVGLIALQAGSSGLVYQDGNGALTIDFTNGAAASGVNTDAHFEIGDPNNGNATYAFNVTNLDSESHDFTFSYTGVTNDTDTGANIQYQVYNSTGSLLGTASEESTYTVSALGSGQTVYVVVVVDTVGLDSTANLSGTLEISA
ncbi:hypothetical protein ACFQPA_08780 [Halomarina halobia]|uniref:Type IV pilin n=1 Tax=Halomarina halobia TaxID=3033386 RepID=A0ABD6ABT9_9EURY|nr:hypothetical protein [Halomarina sp. PSR21]